MKKIINAISIFAALVLSINSQAQVRIFTTYTTGNGGIVIIMSSPYTMQYSSQRNVCSCPQQQTYHQQPARGYAITNNQVENEDMWNYSFQLEDYQQPIYENTSYNQGFIRGYSPQPAYQYGSRFSNTLSDISQLLDVATQAVDLFQLIRRYR